MHHQIREGEYGIESKGNYKIMSALPAPLAAADWMRVSGTNRGELLLKDP